MSGNSPSPSDDMDQDSGSVVHPIEEDWRMIAESPKLRSASQRMEWGDVVKLTDAIAMTMNHLMDFRLSESQVESPNFLATARARIQELCEFYDKAALNDVYYEEIQIPAKSLLKEIATRCFEVAPAVKYKFIETWAKQDLPTCSEGPVTEGWDHDYKVAITIFTLLLARTLVGLTPTSKEYEEDKDERKQAHVRSCYNFQVQLMQNWNSVLSILSPAARTALTVHVKEGHSMKVYNLSDLFRPISKPLATTTMSQELGAQELFHGKPQKKRTTWYIKGVMSFRKKFCQTMLANRWGPENTPGAEAFCGVFAVAQSIAAIEGVPVATVLSELDPVRPKSRGKEDPGNFRAEDLALMLTKIRQDYVLGVVSRIHGTPDSYQVYAVWTPSEPLVEEASRADQVVIWITNNNYVPGNRETWWVVNHWESFGPNAREVPIYLPSTPPGFVESRDHMPMHEQAIMDAFKEQDVLMGIEDDGKFMLDDTAVSDDEGDFEEPMDLDEQE